MCLFIESRSQLFIKNKQKKPKAEINLENVSFLSIGLLGARIRAKAFLPLKAVLFLEYQAQNK